MIFLPFEENEVLVELGLRLKKARMERGEKQAVFAQRLAVCRATYIKMERGNPNIPIGHWLRAAGILGLLDTWEEVLKVEESLFDKHDRMMAEQRVLDKGRVRKKKKTFSKE